MHLLPQLSKPPRSANREEYEASQCGLCGQEGETPTPFEVNECRALKNAFKSGGCCPKQQGAASESD
jgi:hypothetical protein